MKIHKSFICWTWKKNELFIEEKTLKSYILNTSEFKLETNSKKNMKNILDASCKVTPKISVLFPSQKMVELSVILTTVERVRMIIR